jgi:hypothetical protein
MLSSSRASAASALELRKTRPRARHRSPTPTLAHANKVFSDRPENKPFSQPSLSRPSAPPRLGSAPAGCGAAPAPARSPRRRPHDVLELLRLGAAAARRPSPSAAAGDDSVRVSTSPSSVTSVRLSPPAAKLGRSERSRTIARRRAGPDDLSWAARTGHVEQLATTPVSEVGRVAALGSVAPRHRDERAPLGGGSWGGRSPPRPAVARR